MRALALCLAVLALQSAPPLATPVWAQAEVPTMRGADGGLKLDINAVTDEVLRLYAEVDEGASFRYLDASIRTARAKGWLGADAGVLFVLYADALRSLRLNPAYALRIADEGLALVLGGALTDPMDRLMLEVSRAYALADLGRFDEAVAAATLALPMMRQEFGAQQADDLASYIAEWNAGRMSVFNGSALDLARKALERAEVAVDASDQATVLAEASRAILPTGAGFDPGEVALLTAEARALAGRALFLLRRGDEALAMLQAGADTLYGEGWATRPDPQPVVAVPEASRDRIIQLFYWLARSAIDADDRVLAEAALQVSERLARGTGWHGTILFGWMQLSVRDGDHAGVDALADRVVAQARTDGRDDMVALAEFYRATGHASIVPTWAEVDVSALWHSAWATMPFAVPGTAVGGGFVMGELSAFLIHTGNLSAGIATSREAIMDEMMQRADATGPEAEAHATRMRTLAEMHLFAAHELDSRRPEAFCHETGGRGCVIRVQRP